MKRFTETTKWMDPWFRGLTPTQKLLWLYLCDACDNAGIVRPDWDLASFCIGARITEEDTAQLEGRVEVLPDGSLWLAKFVRFQWGNAPRSDNTGRRIWERLAAYGLTERAFSTSPSPTGGLPEGSPRAPRGLRESASKERNREEKEVAYESLQ